MGEKKYKFKKETINEIKKLVRRSRTGSLHDSLQPQKKEYGPPVETRIFRLNDYVEGAEVVEIESIEMLQCSSVEATWHFATLGSPNLAPNDTVVMEIYNIGRNPIASGTFVLAVRDPYSGQFYCQDAQHVWRARATDDLIESDVAGKEVHVIDLGEDVELTGDLTGWRGVAWGSVNSPTWEGDIVDVVQNSDGEWMLLGSGVTHAHGTADAEILDGASGNVSLDNGIVVTAYAHFGDVEADDEVLLHWVGRGSADGAPVVHWCITKANEAEELEAGCGIDITDGVISVDNTALAGTGLQTSGECGLAVNLSAGCGISVAGASIAVNASTLAGSGLITEGTCGLAVNPGCGLLIAGDAVEVDPSDIAGSGLEVAGAGCAVNVKAACGIALVAEGVRVDNTALAGDGLTAGDGCTLDVDCDWIENNCAFEATCDFVEDCLAPECEGEPGSETCTDSPLCAAIKTCITAGDTICDKVTDCLNDPEGDGLLCNAIKGCLDGTGGCEYVKNCVYGDPMGPATYCEGVLDCITANEDFCDWVVDCVRAAGAFCEPPCFEEPAPLWEGLSAQSVSDHEARIAALESQVASLAQMVAELQAKLAV